MSFLADFGCELLADQKFASSSSPLDNSLPMLAGLLLMDQQQQLMAADQLMMEQLKAKERRKCTDLLTELLAQMLPSPMSPECQPLGSAGFSLSPSQSPLSLGSATSSSIASSPWHFSTSSSPQQQQSGMLGDERKMEEAEHPNAIEPRPHKCDQCQKAFRFKSNLFEHKSLHLASGHRTPFVCPFCAKTCRLKGNLKKHLQIHVTSVQDLERLWKRSFSRQSGRPRKDALPTPLPKPGDDLGLVPVLMASSTFSSSSSSSSSMKSQVHHSPGTLPPIQWTFADDADQRELFAEESKMSFSADSIEQVFELTAAAGIAFHTNKAAY